MNCQRGMSIVELMVTMLVLLVLMAGSSVAYLKLMKSQRVESQIGESLMARLSSLELMRYDIEMAGYGLPRDMNGINYNEAVSNAAVAPNPDTFNDSPVSQPRPFAFSDDGSVGAGNSDVLVIKSQVAALNATTPKWSILYYDPVAAAWRVKSWNEASKDFVNNENVIVLDFDKKIGIEGGLWNFSFDVNHFNNVAANTLPLPATLDELYLVYGVTPAATPPRMPFNRVDYYIRRPNNNFPARCFPNSFIFYRSTINHANGARNEQPVLDCVMDFQVAFGLDTNGDGSINNWSTDLIDPVTAAHFTPNKIRSEVRQVAVSILLHEGGRDDSFRFSGFLDLGNLPAVGTTPAVPLLKRFVPAGDALRYRWKVLNLSVKPMNL